jgi:hypothetical protein
MQVVASLCAANFAEYLALKAAHADLHGASSLIAWRARNLLELSVWAVYCGKSVQNAQRFFTDAGRDVLGLFDAFSKWFALSGREWSSNVAVDRAKADLLGRAAARGIDSLDGSYKPVSAAAKEIGMGDPFLVLTSCCRNSPTQPRCKYWQGLTTKRPPCRGMPSYTRDVSSSLGRSKNLRDN